MEEVAQPLQPSLPRPPHPPPPLTIVRSIRAKTGETVPTVILATVVLALPPIKETIASIRLTTGRSPARMLMWGPRSMLRN